MPPRIQGWDPVLIIAQIVCLQSLHYITLSFLIPPLLAMFAEPHALAHQGGAASVSMVMDWREMAGRPTLTGDEGDISRGWSAFRGVWTGGHHVTGGSALQGWEWEAGVDPARGWVLAFSWLLASGADILFVYQIVRKPTHVLDFALTLLLNHLILTTYYSSSLPSSLFFWLILIAGTAITIIFAEQLCVRREMQEGLGAAYTELDMRHEGAEAGDVLAQDHASGNGETIELGRYPGR